MITVLNDVKKAYRDNSVQKNYFVFFRDYEKVLTNNEIVQESLSITESICSAGNFKVGLCESAVANIQVALEPNVKGDEMTIVQTLNGFEPEIEIDDDYGVQISGDSVTTLYRNSSFVASNLVIYNSNTTFQMGHYYLMLLKVDYIGNEIYIYTASIMGLRKMLYYVRSGAFGFNDVSDWSASGQYPYGKIVRKDGHAYKNIDIHSQYNTTDPAVSDTWEDVTKRLQVVIPVIGENMLNYKLGLWSEHVELTGAVAVYEINVPVMPLGLYQISDCKKQNDSAIRTLTGYDRMQDVQLDETIVYSGIQGQSSTIGSILDVAAAGTQIKIGSNRTKERIEVALLDEDSETVAITNDDIYQTEHDEYITIEGTLVPTDETTQYYTREWKTLRGSGVQHSDHLWLWLFSRNFDGVGYTVRNKKEMISGANFSEEKIRIHFNNGAQYVVGYVDGNLNTYTRFYYKLGGKTYNDPDPGSGWIKYRRLNETKPSTHYDRKANYPAGLSGSRIEAYPAYGPFSYDVEYFRYHYYKFTFDVPDGWTYVEGSEKVTRDETVFLDYRCTRKYTRHVVDGSWKEPSLVKKTITYGIPNYTVEGLYKYSITVQPPQNYGMYLVEDQRIRQGIVQASATAHGGYITTNRQNVVRQAIINDSTHEAVEIEIDTPYGNYGVFTVSYVEKINYTGTNEGSITAGPPSVVIERVLDDEVLAQEVVTWNNATVTATRRAIIAAYLELNSIFIHFDRYGVSTFLNIEMSTLYPALNLFPQTTGLYPTEGAQEYFGGEENGYCKSLNIDDELNAPFDGVLIIKSNPASSEASLYPFYYNRPQKRYGTVPASMPEIGYWPENKYYVIKSNFFIDNFIFTQNQLKFICQTIIKRVGDLQYFNLNAELKCLPYMEVGDSINIQLPKAGYETVILRRTMKGCIAQMDNYETEFFSDKGGSVL